MKRFNTFTLAVASLFFAITLMSDGVASAVPVITNGLVAAYEFNGNANDVSGNGNNGVVNGATLTTNRFGNPNSAYSFDGVNDYLVSSTTFSPQASGTISLWYNQLGIFPTDQFVGSRSAQGYQPGDFMFGTNPISNEPGACYWGNFGNWHCAEGHTADELTFAITSDSHHVVWTWDTGNDEAFFYINDELVGTAGATLPIFGNLPLQIGRHTGAGTTPSYFHGELDDLYIYDRALSPTEVSTLYSVIPEPNTALLLGFGLVGLGVKRRRPRGASHSGNGRASS